MANGNRPAPKRPTSKTGLKPVRGVALGAASVCALSVAVGTYPDALASGGALGCLIPLGASVVVGAGIGTGWHYVLGLAAHAKETGETHKKALAACLGGALVAIGCATSAWFLTSIIGGATAVQGYELAYVEKLRHAADVVAVNAGFDQGLVSAIESGGNAIHATAESECRAGAARALFTGL